MTYVDTSEESQVILSLCPGFRGLERGLERAMGGGRLRVAAYVEIEAFIIENLLAAMETGLLDAAPIWSDLKTFQWDIFRGKIHGFVGGYPCQPFSVAGNQLGEEDPRHLWPYIKEGIRTVGPLWCFFENVGGHLNIGYETVRRELQELGYRVEEGIFSAEEVGAPHRRERLFILAVENTYSIRERHISRYAGGAFGRENVQQENRKECPIWAKSTSKMAHSNSSGSLKDFESCKLWTEGLIESSGYSWVSNQKKEIKIQEPERWPAGAGGSFQYEHEEPRTVKSGMGITINGYNFREDLLRAAGNGVVEQTAELAWNILWQKHSKNL